MKQESGRLYLKRTRGLERIFWWFYAICISIPWHSTANRFLSMIQLSGNFSLIQVCALAMVAVIVLKTFPKVRISKSNIVFSAFFLTVMIGVGNGIKYGTSMILDFDMIFVGIACYIITSSKNVQQLDIYKFLKFTTSCMNINGFINLVIYLTRSWSFWGVETTDTGRFGAGYFTLFLITGCFSFYSLCVNESENTVSKKVAVLNLALTVFTFTVSAVRTNLLVLMLVCVCIYIMTVMKTMSKTQLLFRIVVIIVGAAVVMYMLYGSSILSSRFSTGNSLLKEGNFAIRISTISYYINELKLRPWFGYGLGYMLHFVHPRGFALDDQLSIDNSFMYIAIKMGIIALVMYFALIVVVPIIQIKKKYELRDIKNILIISYLGFIFATSIMTNQIVYTYADLIFAWTFIGLLCNKGTNDYRSKG